MNERSAAGQAAVAQSGEDTQVVHTEGNTVVTDIAMAIANAKDAEPTDIDPLGDTIDCQALEDLVGSSSTSLSISFTYDDVEVFVTNDGYIEVSSADPTVDTV